MQRRALSAGWALVIGALAVGWSQGCFDAGQAPEAEAPAPSPVADEPALLPATKADAGAGARKKKDDAKKLEALELVPATKYGGVRPPTEPALLPATKAGPVAPPDLMPATKSGMVPPPEPQNAAEPTQQAPQ
jgi:hypothetical protein